MSIGFGLGLSNFTFTTADGYWEWVRLCDESGIDSIWQTDRLISKEPFLEVMSSMAALAGATKNVKFGMNVASLGFRDPLVTAKQCATIDYLSNGRLLPAFGLGSTLSRDWVGSGRATKGRGQRMNEVLEVMTRLWSEESVTFEGKHFRYDDASISPRPVQKVLPCWIGGSADAAIERTAKYGTGWQASFQTAERTGEVVAAIHEACARHGRKMDPDHMGVGFGIRFGNWDEPIVAKTAEALKKRTKRDPKQGMAVGGADEILKMMGSFIPQGIAKFILRPIGDGDAEMIEQTEKIIAEILPEVSRLNERRKAGEWGTAAA
jgi:probable F420-dependent oxidoreductase